MGDLTIFKKKGLQTYEYAAEDLQKTDLAVGFTSGTPSIRLDKNTFNLVEAGTRTPIGSKIVGVILDSGGLSRRYYKGAYTGGKDDHAPDCASLNTIQPDVGITTPECSTCHDCPMSVWGSATGLGGKAVTACKQYRRIVFCMFDKSWEDGYRIFRFDIPGGSLKNAAEYSKTLIQNYHTPVSAVFTQISFAPQGTTELMFDAVNLLNENRYAEIKKLQALPIVKEILSMQSAAPTKEEAPEKTTKVVKATKAATAVDVPTEGVTGATLVNTKQAEAADKPVEILEGQLDDVLDGLELSI